MLLAVLHKYHCFCCADTSGWLGDNESLAKSSSLSLHCKYFVTRLLLFPVSLLPSTLPRLLHFLMIIIVALFFFLFKQLAQYKRGVSSQRIRSALIGLRKKRTKNHNPLQDSNYGKYTFEHSSGGGV